MKSMNPSPDFGTPCSGQSVNWNWRTVRDWPSWMWREAFHDLPYREDFSLQSKGRGRAQRWLTLASVTLNSRRMYWGMLYSAMGSTTKYWYLAERSAGQYWWHFSCSAKNCRSESPVSSQKTLCLVIFGPKVNERNRLYNWMNIQRLDIGHSSMDRL